MPLGVDVGRFSLESRSTVAGMFYTWARRPAFQDPSRLLNKVPALSNMDVVGSMLIRSHHLSPHHFSGCVCHRRASAQQEYEEQG